uniref:Aspartic peptidase n=1 Tax=Tanacetum cinerariifolium TaxID=118510 RepID=A0A699H7J7_TANCI|nr:aspartic peptidase [Tanacetum cinerariifolium]
MVRTQAEIKESSNSVDDSTKDIPIIELSDDEVPVPVKRKRGRLVKDGCLINNNVVEIVSSDDEKGVSLADTRMDFDDEEPIRFSRFKKKPRTSLSKSHAFSLIDEDLDEEFDNIKTFIQDNEFDNNNITEEGTDDDDRIDLEETKNNTDEMNLQMT